ncbi:hypothetical protein LCN96_24650 [Nonomuraea gerenzanensis]|nr:hypothetical protein [Nonomuraea gerenzanensis]UBU18095.1 hypothetical protein LCN96_24650 [Nonomuraea gerenzanensis]
MARSELTSPPEASPETQAPPYVANGGKVVPGAAAEKAVLPLVTPLFTGQG